MASRKRSARIEPTFGAPFAGEEPGGFRLSDADRVVPQAGRGRKKSNTAAAGKQAPARRSKGGSGGNLANNSSRRSRGRRRRRQGGGFFGFLRRATYWMMVLGLWVGIAGVGVGTGLTTKVKVTVVEQPHSLVTLATMVCALTILA